MPGSEKQNSMFKPSSGYIQKNNPFPVTSCGRRRNSGSPLYKKKDFESHMMYKDKSAILADTYEEHLELKEKGYGHTKPKNNK